LDPVAPDLWLCRLQQLVLQPVLKFEFEQLLKFVEQLLVVEL
jgi:hypothetical protein